LKISHRTVDVHRARIMQKTGVDNLVELANLARDGSAEPTNAKPPGPET
jgi:DNA-binding NarL/FixJ family response regulator